MAAPLLLIHQIGRRLRRHQQVNTIGFFLPLAGALLVVCYVFLPAFSLSPFLAVIPSLLMLTVALLMSLWHMRQAGEREAAAALLDEKTDGQERFLSLATVTQTTHNTPLLALLQRQAEKKAASFTAARDVPFTLDRRVPWALLAAVVLCALALFFAPHVPPVAPTTAASRIDTALSNLQEVARTLLRKGATPEQQATGAELQVLVQELKNPALSPREKIQLIDEAQERLNLPLPRLLPFDLKLFGSDSNNEEADGQQSDTPQSGEQPLAKANEKLEQLKKTLSAAAGDEPQPGPRKDGKQQKQEQPRESGGGIKFDQPESQTGEKKERSGQDPSGQQKPSSEEAAPDSQTSGTDPNRPGGQQDQGQDQGQKGPQSSPQQSEQQPQGTGKTIGQGRGERFLQPGEQPGDFLTKDVGYVKVRVPIGPEAQDGQGELTENRSKARPQTPYSNAPLKEGAPDKAQAKQPIPLEYRQVLQ